MDGKASRVHQTLIFENRDGHELRKIQKRMLRVKDSMEIEDAGGKRAAMVKKALITPVRERWTVKVADGPDLEVQGNILDHESAKAATKSPRCPEVVPNCGYLRCRDRARPERRADAGRSGLHRRGGSPRSLRQRLVPATARVAFEPEVEHDSCRCSVRPRTMFLVIRMIGGESDEQGKHGTHHNEAHAGPGDAEAGPAGKMKTMEYEREMRRLQGELVAVQEWVKTTGARVCIARSPLPALAARARIHIPYRKSVAFPKAHAHTWRYVILQPRLRNWFSTRAQQRDVSGC